MVSMKETVLDGPFATYTVAPSGAAPTPVGPLPTSVDVTRRSRRTSKEWAVPVPLLAT
ncbi:hypothetical protein [Streptomyces aureocirculatus]|uniref:hypothetical protein n=1 Tax=Streptomyces aureocirculatus TaxID=67275 RepID=UPI001CEE024D|nr:hypothetical protein [Streptomyces aureocirculatus]